jgi:fibronectin-binding autotransporter adhesin
MRMRPLLLLTVLALSSSSLFGQTTFVWNGGTSGIGTSWNSGANWVGGSVPTTGANLLFDNSNNAGTIASPLSVSATRTVGLITFDQVNNKLPATLQIDTNGSGGSVARTLTINTGISILNHVGTVQFNATNFGVLTIALGGSNVTFDPQSTSTLTLNPVITGANNGITKSGTGTLILGGNNTYSGSTAVNSGTLRLGASGAINSSPTITVANGATYDVSPVTGGYTLGSASAQTIRGSGAVTGATTVSANGTVFADTIGLTAAPLTTGNLLFNNGGNFRVQVGNGATASDLTTVGAGRVAATGAGVGTLFGRSAGTGLIDIQLEKDGSIQDLTSYTRRIAAYGTLSNLSNGTYTASDSVFSMSGVGFGISNDWQVIVGSGGSFVDITFTPVPEPGTVFALGAAVLGAGAFVRRRFGKKVVAADVTAAA